MSTSTTTEAFETLMPEPDHSLDNGTLHFYTAEQMRAMFDAATERAAKLCDATMVDMTPPATARDRWMYQQGRLAERDPRTHRAELIEEMCARIKAADDAAADADYMLDSNDCIAVLRGTWPNCAAAIRARDEGVSNV